VRDSIYVAHHVAPGKNFKPECSQAAHKHMKPKDYDREAPHHQEVLGMIQADILSTCIHHLHHQARYESLTPRVRKAPRHRLLDAVAS
jgi:hypothetical protein